MAEGDDLITVADAAARTGYTVQHIARLLRQGKLAGRRFGKVWLTTVAAVEAYRRSDPKPAHDPRLSAALRSQIEFPPSEPR